jgi:hypothetical protein
MAIGPKNVQFLDNENYQCTKVLQVLNCLFFLETSRFDHFQKVDYDEYVTSKLKRNGLLDNTDPAAWFALEDPDRSSVIDLNCRYKLLSINQTPR